MNFVEIVKAIPAIVTVVKSIISLIKSIREKQHTDAMAQLDKSKTKQEVKDALNDVAKNP